MNIRSTLHGYRVQFLYTLFRMMLSDNAQEVFVPEGKEDLDIYVDGVLTECIQVKCNKDRLTYIDLYSSGKTTSLYRRALESLSENSAVKVNVVSINGVISDELTDKAKLKRKLKADPVLKLKELNAKILANTIDATVFEEQKMLSAIESELKSRFVEVNPIIGIRLLTEWIYEAAEKGEQLTIHDLEQEILAIVVFQSRIQAFHNQLGYAIVPLFMDNSLGNCDEQTLSKAFYEGVSTRPEHIVVGLDIERREIENDVEIAFKKSNIVIVHGLSGAGKSTFAYRYIYENASAMAYEIRNCNSNNLNDVLASLSAITKGLRIPAMFFFDVNSSNMEWIDAIAILAGRKDIRCLVTMRQEDWNIQYPRISTAFNFEDVTLELCREEAEKIYNRLQEKGVDAHRSFEVVWEESEQSGNLLEFIYSMTHGETLENRIKNQICCESEQSQHLLGYISTANFFGGYMNVGGLLQLSGLNIIEVSSLLERLQHEFFRIEDNVIKDVHPVRTKFIVKALFGDRHLLLKETAMEIFNKIDIPDGHLYILRMMKECGLTVDELIDEFSNKELSPNQAYSIARSLLWCGIFDYEKKHEGLISELSNLIGPLWELFLPMNFTGIDLKNSQSVFEKLIPNFPDATKILSQFSNQQEIFCHFERWLKSRDFWFKPTNHREWYVLSKLLSIVSWVNVKSIDIIGSPDSQTIKSESLDECARILLGLKCSGRADLVSDYERQFVKRLRQDYHIIQFKKKKHSLQMLSFLDYNNESNDDAKDYNGFITERTNIRLIDLCRFAFPEMEEYRSEILKDDLINSFEDMPTEKHITRENLPLGEMHEPRAVFCNLYKKEHGIDNREKYANLVLLKRRDYIRANTIVMHFLDEWHKNPKMAFKGYENLIKELAEFADKTELSIPISEISEFAYGRSNNIYSQTNGDAKLIKLEDIYQSVDKYFSGLRMFYYQFPKAIANEENFKNTASANLFDTIILLPSFQSDFMNVFGKYIPEGELDGVDEKEARSIKSLWVVWESLRDGFDYSNVCQLLQRCDKMKMSLIDRLVDAIIKEWQKCGFDNDRLHISVNKKMIEVDFLFSSEEECNRSFYCIQMAIANKLSGYNFFSTQRIILQNEIDKLVVKPLYQLSNGFEMSLDGLQFVCGMEGLLVKAEDVVKNSASYFFVPEQIENDNSITELNAFNQLNSVLNLIIWTCNKLLSINGQISEGDSIAKMIFDDYRFACEKKILEVDTTFFDVLSAIEIQDSVVKDSIRDAIEVLKQYLASIESKSNWFLGAGKLKEVFDQINNMKMYAQMQLLSGIKLN